MRSFLPRPITSGCSNLIYAVRLRNITQAMFRNTAAHSMTGIAQAPGPDLRPFPACREEAPPCIHAISNIPGTVEATRKSADNRRLISETHDEKYQGWGPFREAPPARSREPGVFPPVAENTSNSMQNLAMSNPMLFVPLRSQDGVEDVSQVSPIVGNRVELQLLTTLTCNLKCALPIFGVGDMVGSQGKVSYTPDVLDAFIKKHLSEHEIYVTFYGGEPTLNLDFIEEIMGRYPTFRFQLQTNGTLLDGLPDRVLSNLSNILISIDGGEAITDGFRGQGVYRQVVKNSQTVRDRMKGTFTARVTWSSEETSFDELDELASTFDYVYFQFVAGEGTYTPDAMEKKKKVITQLVDKFFSSSDKLYPIIPIMGVVRNKVLPTRATELYHGKTQCRVSTHILNVMPDGKIFRSEEHTSELQ